MKPRLLDLFCGAGGCSVGYARAGFEVVGIDIAPQPNYPFAFVQGDALRPPVDLAVFDVIHASPPCQAYTSMSNRWRGAGGLADERPDLIDAAREVIRATGKPYVMENVRCSPLNNPIELTGEMFGLLVHRPRLFECSAVHVGAVARGSSEGPGADLWEDGRTTPLDASRRHRTSCPELAQGTGPRHRHRLDDVGRDQGGRPARLYALDRAATT